MKTSNSYQIGMSIIIIVFSILLPANATGTKKLKASNEPSALATELSNPGSSGINIILYDGIDRVVYNDILPVGSSFEDEFDFSTVRNGTYRIVSELGNMRYNGVFKVSENAVEYTERYYSFVPQFKKEEGMLLVHYLKNPQDNVGISIEDETGRIFDAYYEEQGFVFSNTYGLKDLQPGSYVIHLVSGEEHFFYAFDIE